MKYVEYVRAELVRVMWLSQYYRIISIHIRKTAKRMRYLCYVYRPNMAIIRHTKKNRKEIFTAA
jgi:hypothetical protein